MWVVGRADEGCYGAVVGGVGRVGTGGGAVCGALK